MPKSKLIRIMVPLLSLFRNSSENSVAGKQKAPDARTGTLEKIIIGDPHERKAISNIELRGVPRWELDVRCSAFSLVLTADYADQDKFKQKPNLETMKP